MSVQTADPPFAKIRPETASGADLVIVFLLCTGGFLFLRDAQAWAPNVYIGHDQFGDADFWWQGVLEMSQGIFWDNVNFTLRMGYAIFGGLLVALFGPSYAIFHEFLIFLFLSVASCIYVAGMSRIGRLSAFALASTLVFSPLTAERLAISTSDGLGLIFNVLALLALWIALDGGRRPLFALFSAGVFLAFAALTRPLMTLFAIPAAVLAFMHAQGSLWKRATHIVVLSLAIAVPTLIWAAGFYFKTGSVGLAGNDASIFYAASDPKIQVWSPAMYTPIAEAAKARLGVSEVTNLQVDDEFRQQTAANYVSNLAYHVKRLPRNIWAIANFSFRDTNPKDCSEFWSRLLIRGGLAIALLVWCVLERRWSGFAAALVVFLLSISPDGAAIIVLAGSVLFIVPVRWPQLGIIHRLTAAYWWTGVAAIFLTGGIWGMPLTPDTQINALGYRLGGQFLFANDWLILLMISAAAGQPRSASAWLQNFWLFRVDGTPVLRFARWACLSGVLALFVGGLSIFGVRAWQRDHSVPVAMPAVEPLMSAFCVAAGDLFPRPIVPQPPSILSEMWGEARPDQRVEALELFTGATGGLIWQMPEQMRTRALYYQQDRSSPFTFNRIRNDVEFSGLLNEAQWRNRQGLWVIRSFREVGAHFANPYYETLPKVKMFVPLTSDSQSFDLSKAEYFPIGRYASILAYSGHLIPIDATLSWLKYHAGDPKRRWFILEPTASSVNRDAAIQIGVNDATGHRSLSFSFRVEPVPGNALGLDPISITVSAVNASGQSRTLIARSSPAHGGAVDTPSDDVVTAVPDEATLVRVAFHGVGAKEMVRVIELQLVSDDVSPGITDSLCAQHQ